MIDKIKEYISRSPKTVMYILVAIGCIIVLFVSGNGSASNEETIDFPNAQTDYAKEIEKQLRSVIAKIEGVGDVTVMVTVDGTVSYDYQMNVSQSESRSDTDTVIISNKEPLVKKIENPKVSGVLVICDGGDSIKIREKIIYAVSTVLDIPTNKVYITR